MNALPITGELLAIDMAQRQLDPVVLADPLGADVQSQSVNRKGNEPMINKLSMLVIGTVLTACALVMENSDRTSSPPT